MAGEVEVGDRRHRPCGLPAATSKGCYGLFVGRNLPSDGASRPQAYLVTQPAPRAQDRTHKSKGDKVIPSFNRPDLKPMAGEELVDQARGRHKAEPPDDTRCHSRDEGRTPRRHVPHGGDHEGHEHGLDERGQNGDVFGLIQRLPTIMLARTHATTANQLIEPKSISASFGYEYRIVTRPSITDRRPKARPPSALGLRQAPPSLGTRQSTPGREGSSFLAM